MNIQNLFLIAMSTYCLYGCAHVEAPKGGPEDKTGPEVMQTYPKHQAVLVDRSTSIRLEFNEWVDQKLTAKDFQFSPPLALSPKVDVDGMRVEISPRQPLDSLKTYTLSLGKSVKDMRGNALKSPLKLSFSTGPILDSLKVSGLIHKKSKRVSGSVAFYPYEHFWEKVDSIVHFKPDTSVNQKKPSFPKAAYSTFADSLGKFEVSHLASGMWVLVAFEDLNGNNKPDWNTEWTAFIDSVESQKQPSLKFALTLDSLFEVPKKDAKGVEKVNSPSDSLRKNVKITRKNQFILTPLKNASVGLNANIQIRSDSNIILQEWQNQVKAVLQGDTLPVSIDQKDSVTLSFVLPKSLLYNQNVQIYRVFPVTKDSNKIELLHKFSTWEELAVSKIQGRIDQGTIKTWVMIHPEKMGADSTQDVRVQCTRNGTFTTSDLLNGTYSAWWFEDINQNQRWDGIDWSLHRKAEPSGFISSFEVKKGKMTEVNWPAAY